MSGPASTRITVSLDTNILHYVGLFLDHAKDQNVPCDANTGDVLGRIATLLGGLETQAKDATTRSLRQGGQTLKWLIEEDVDVHYSMLSELELLAGRTRGRAIVHASKEGLPDRMWWRFPQQEIRERVGPQEIAALQKGVHELVKRMEATGVSIGQLSESHMAEVPEVAQGLCGLVYMDPLDGLIYATCLVTQANYLVTTDKYLTTTVNGIFKGSDQRYQDIRGGLIDLMKMVIGNGDSGLTVPSAHMITADGNVRPDPQQFRGAVGV